MYWCGVGVGDVQREAEEESSLCGGASEGLGVYLCWQEVW